MSPRVFVLVALIGSTLAVVAQDAVHPANKLIIGSRREVPFASVEQTVGTPKCDAAGNVYSRPIGHGDSDDAFFFAATKEVTTEGIMTGSFSLRNALQDGLGRGIFVDGKATVYQAAFVPGAGVYVLAFAQDGSVKAKTKLDTRTEIDPWHVAVFQSGGLLISGLSGEHNRTPYTAVFDASGKLVKRIYEPEDEDARSKAVLGNSEFTHDGQIGNSFVTGGDVTLGADGNAYVLRGGPAPLVYVISPTGQVIRKMQIGLRGSGLPFSTITSYEGKLAIGLATWGHTEVRVTSLDGVASDSYRLDTNKTDVLELACYDSRGFTFISGISGGTGYLLNAKP